MTANEESKTTKTGPEIRTKTGPEIRAEAEQALEQARDALEKARDAVALLEGKGYAGCWERIFDLAYGTGQVRDRLRALDPPTGVFDA